MSAPTFQALDALTLAGGNDQYPQHTYTYLVCDLLTDTVIAELPLQQVVYETLLSGIGTLRAFLPLNSETLPLDPIGATVGGRTALYVDRDGVIVWGGILWTRQLARGGLQIQAAEFLSYYQHRYITETLSTVVANVPNKPALMPNGNLLYSDQKSLMWSLCEYARRATGGDIHLDVNPLAGTGHGVNRTRTYYGYERPELYSTMLQLSQVDDGFDFGVEVGWNPVLNNNPPTRYKRIKTWYPQRGRTADDSGLVFSKGGPAANIVAYDWPEDYTAKANQTWAIGDGDGEARLIAGASDPDSLMSGWPLLEYVATYSGVVEAPTLQGHANADLNARADAAVAPWFDVLADADPQFGSYQNGDSALFSIAPEPRWPDGMEVEARIIGMQVTASGGPEIVRLTCTGV